MNSLLLVGLGNPGKEYENTRHNAGSDFVRMLCNKYEISLGFNQFVGTTKMVDEEAVYKVTKAFWENIGDIHKTAVFLKQVTKETAFTSVNVPLHKGAYRYYKEAGFNIPENIIPKD